MANFQIKGVNTVIIQVRDLEESIHFYNNILQLHKGYVDESMAYFSFGAEDNETTILLHTVDEPEPTEKGIVIELLVDNVLSAVTSIKKAGYTVIQDPVDREWGVKEAVIEDPDKYKIWLAQPLG